MQRWGNVGSLAAGVGRSLPSYAVDHYERKRGNNARKKLHGGLDVRACQWQGSISSRVKSTSLFHLNERYFMVTCGHRIHIEPPAPAKECACNAWAICLGLHGQ